MTKQLVFINLPITDLARSIAFYEAIGATRNPMFSDDTTACMVFSDTIHAMLMTHEKFSLFTKKPIADVRNTCAVLLCLSAGSRDAVDDMIAAAAAVGTADPSPVQDHGFMYGRSFEDPDGHSWEVMWMEVDAMLAARSQHP